MAATHVYRWAGLSVVGVWAAASCADLPVILPDDCGNGFVDAHEDCDTSLDKDGKSCAKSPDTCVCRQRGEVDACRWRCSDTMKCPSKPNEVWGCGADHVCRRPMLCKDKLCPGFHETAAIPESASQLAVADFDGSGRGSVLSVASPLVSVHYFDDQGRLTKTSSIVAPSAAPAVGFLTDSAPKIADFSMNASRGLSVMLGSSDQVLSPVVYASVEVQDKKYLVLPLVPASDKGMKPAISPQLSLYYAPYDDKGRLSSLIDPNAMGKPPVMLQTLGGAGGATLAGNVLIDRFSTGFPCLQYGFAFQGAQQAIVYSPCQADGSRNGESDSGFIAPTKIGLKGGSGHICAQGDMPCAGIDALHAVDVDKDGKLDLVIAAVKGAPMNPMKLDAEIHIAYNNGDGSFSSSPGLVPADNLADLYDITNYVPALPQFDGGDPDMGADHNTDVIVAVGDLNEDCALDYVNRFGIYLSYKGNKTCAAPESFFSLSTLELDHNWTTGRIAEMTGDNHLDVALGSAMDQGITFYKGTGTNLLNPTKLATTAAVRSFALGDFDGDAVLDLAFSQAGSADSTSGAKDALAIMFGNAGASPSQPVVMGETNSILQVVTGAVYGISPDAIDDLFVVSERYETDPKDSNKQLYFQDMALFPGTADRQLRAPFYLLNGKIGARPDPPRTTAIGHFIAGNTTHGDIAVLGDIATCPGSQSARCTTLWLLHSIKEAEIAAFGANASPRVDAPLLDTVKAVMGGEPDITAAQLPMESVDLDSKGDPATDTDEVVFVAGGSPPSLYVASAVTDNAGPHFAVKPGISLDAVRGQGGMPGVSSRDLQIITADVDGDPDRRRDVVVASPNDVLVIWNQGKGTLDPGSATRISLSDLGLVPCVPMMMMGPMQQCPMIRGVAAVNLDADAAKELVIVTTEGSYVVDFNGTALVPRRQAELPRGDAIVGGDVNGDGVDDVVIGQKGGIQVFLGKPADPGRTSDLPSAASDAGAP